jgi:hypothetical protein
VVRCNQHAPANFSGWDLLPSNAVEKVVALASTGVARNAWIVSVFTSVAILDHYGQLVWTVPTDRVRRLGHIYAFPMSLCVHRKPV